MRDSFGPILLACLVFLAFGCGSKEKAPRITDAGTASGAETWSASDGVAVVRGVAHFQGTPPKPRRIDMGAANYCEEKYKAEHGHYPLDPSIQVKDGKLANVFVFVKSGLSAWKFPVPATPKVLDQKHCLYVPHVQGIQVGQKLSIVNSDPLLHQVLVAYKNHMLFPQLVQTGGDRASKSFDRECIMVSITCNVHSWMQAYIGVLDHPFYAVTAEDGTYTLPKLPAGTYTLVAWHEKFGRKTATVTIGKGQTKEVDFTFGVSG